MPQDNPPLNVQFDTVFAFPPAAIGTNANTNGANPSTLITDGSGTFHRTTSGGGDNGTGTVFLYSPSEASFDLHDFSPLPSGTPPTNPDGAYTYSPVVSDGNGDLFGTTPQGGTNGYGTIFEINNSQELRPGLLFHGPHLPAGTWQKPARLRQ